MGNPLAVRKGPGILKAAPIGTAVPTDLATAWNVAWVDLGYTDEGSEFVFNQTFEDVMVAEELEPIDVIQTVRQTLLRFALSELSAANMQRAQNGGTITGTTTLSFEPPGVGAYTPIMLGWEDLAATTKERWVFRRCIQQGSFTIPRRKGAVKSSLTGLEFSAVKPSGAAAFVFLHDADWT